MSKAGPGTGERIAKVMARAGLASRRKAELMILAGRVSINGKIVMSPARNVSNHDRIEVDGKPLPKPEPTRIWRFYKPSGVVSTSSDEKGRPTIYDVLKQDLPLVMPVGRLDLNSEGLLLLTNDGESKRRLELPQTGWLRRYRVRARGRPSETAIARLRDGIVVGGEKFQPMEIGFDRQQGANAWLTIGLREGRNREIRRALKSVNLDVNRLIRISFGPFRLGELGKGDVKEVPARVVRDQLGGRKKPSARAKKRPRPDSERKAGKSRQKRWFRGKATRHGNHPNAAGSSRRPQRPPGKRRTHKGKRSRQG